MIYFPKVSVLVPVYNVEKYIERCARSVLDQSYDNVEVVFVNDASPDKSVDVLQKVLRDYPNKDVRIVDHTTNKGLAAARMTAIKHASGEYVFHVDSDDYLEKDAIKLCVDASRNGSCDIVLGNFRHIYPNRVIPIYRKEEYVIDDMVCDILVRKQPCNIWGSLIRKSLYENLEIPPIDNGEDFVTFPRLVCRSCSLGFVKEIIYNYTHLNAHSFQFNRLNEKNRSDRRLVTDFLLEFFRDKMATSAQYGKAIHIMILNFCVSDLIFSYSFKALRSLSISENLLKNDYIRELKGSHRMMMVLYKKKFYSLILICNYIFRFIKRKNMGHGGL